MRKAATEAKKQLQLCLGQRAGGGGGGGWGKRHPVAWVWGFEWGCHKLELKGTAGFGNAGQKLVGDVG